MKFSMLDVLNTSITGFVVVLIILALLACIIVVLSKVIQFAEKMATKNAPAKEVSESKPAVNGVALPETQSEGSLDLYKTDEKTAAIIMAIVSHNSGIPLNRLQFNSIKLIEK